ncbi:MAG: DNA-3-methyladenine glycosylase I, partial [Paracoccaceae bacterium]
SCGTCWHGTICVMDPCCTWCLGDDLYEHYHDHEWGVPCRDETTLFEMLNLEGAQAGLSWITILRKRENYRRAFASFDKHKIARFTDAKVEKLVLDAGIVRHRQKIQAFIHNAKVAVAMEKDGDSLVEFLWSFTDGETLVHEPKSMADVPAVTAESTAMSKALKKRGFKFVGPTTCYAFMQACGMVNDHLVGCPAR